MPSGDSQEPVGSFVAQACQWSPWSHWGSWRVRERLVLFAGGAAIEEPAELDPLSIAARAKPSIAVGRNENDPMRDASLLVIEMRSLHRLKVAALSKAHWQRARSIPDFL
jgi:hypothetical protein